MALAQRGRPVTAAPRGVRVRALDASRRGARTRGRLPQATRVVGNGVRRSRRRDRANPAIPGTSVDGWGARRLLALTGMRRLLAATLLSCLVSSQAAAFDWNSHTATHEIDLLDGRMKIQSGHPLATFRAFELASQRADARGALSYTLGSNWPHELSEPLQTVLFGSWLNEVNTSLDMGGSKPLEWAAALMGWRYSKYLGGRERSDRWTEDTGYTANNFQHSMLVTSSAPGADNSQNNTFRIMEDFYYASARKAVYNLIVALKAREDGSMSDDQIDIEWVSGLRFVGNIFHSIEDSSVNCSEAAQTIVPTCLPGDGHGVVKVTSSGHRQVVSLSNNTWYDRSDANGVHPHGLLDDLYRRENLQTIYGDFDPAITNSQILITVAKAVRDGVFDLEGVAIFNSDGTVNAAFQTKANEVAMAAANEVMGHIRWRYAPEAERQEMPPVPGDGKSDGGGNHEDEGEDTGCAAGGGAGGLAAFGLLGLVGLVKRRRS